jgi:hypothetical protein
VVKKIEKLMKKELTTIGLTFCVYGEYFDLEELTRIAGFPPTDKAYKGDALKHRISEETFWEYKFLPIETLYISDCLAVFEQKVHPFLEELSAFIKTHQLTALFRFCVNIYNEEVPALSFDTSAIDLLHQLNGWIDIDQYIY